MTSIQYLGNSSVNIYPNPFY